MKHAACILAAILANVCGIYRTTAAPFSLSSDEFPIIMMGLGSRAYIPSIAEDLKCDYVHIYVMCTSTNQADLDRDHLFFDHAATNGVKVMACLRANQWVEKTNGLPQMLTCVNEFKNRSSLGYWYMFDEPYNHSVTSAVVEQYYQAVKAESPGVLVANAHAWSPSRFDFEDGQDILMNDNYPVSAEPFPTAPIDQMTTFTENAIKQGEPVIPILQSCRCTWRGEGMRFPNRAELRYWVYATTILGVRGVAWYTHSAARDGGDTTWLDGTFGPMLVNFRAFVDTVEPAHGVNKMHGGDNDTHCLGVWDRGSSGTWMVLVNDRNYTQTITHWMDRKFAAANLQPCAGTREVNARIRDGFLESIPLEPWETFVWEVIVLDVPATPTNVRATATSTARIELTWTDTATNETAFTIDRQKLGDTNWMFVGETQADSTTYRDTAGLDPDSTYTYRIKAYNALGNGLYGEAFAKTLTGMDVPPAGGDDDAEENTATGGVGLDSSDLDLVNDGGADQIIGIRFPGLRIPHGATIHAAHLQFTVAETSSVPTSLTVQGQAIDHAPAFTDTTHNISARATTGVSVSWTPAAWNTEGACGPDQRTPDLAAILQAIVDRPGWTIGNALALIVSGTGKRVAESANGATGAAPFLNIYCSTTYVDLQPGADDDDAEESVASGSMFLSGHLELVNDGGTDQLVGLRFSNISIPQGAAIQTAHLQFTAAETSSVPTSLTVRGQEIDDAPAFTNSMFNISSRTRTSAFVAWSPPAWNQVGQRYADQRTPDLAEIIQAIVDRTGWAYGNALALIINGTGTRTAESATGAAGAAPLLHIRYHSTAQSFTAYNDLAWFGGQLSNRITTFTTTHDFPEGTPEGRLIDHATGEPLAIRVTVQGGSHPREDRGLHPSPHTDAYTVFNGKLEADGMVSYSVDNLVITLTELCPNKRYEFVLYGDRNAPTYTGENARHQHATLSGAAGFVNTSTPGTSILTNSVPNDTTLCDTGYNNPYGFVTRFSQIDPGADGKIVVTVAHDGEQSYYTYANAFMLAGHDVVKVAKGTNWKYREGTAEASDPPTAWQMRTFNDTAWNNGAAPFGYGDGPYGTTLADMFGNYVSVFLRTPFTIDQPTRVSQLELRALFDDGLIAWINGAEVGRTNVAGGPGTFVPYNVPTPAPIGPAEWVAVLKGRALPALVAGTNILALQVFNRALDSSDLTLDCRLTVAEGARVIQDADSDGMPDPWETDKFGDTNVANAGTEQDFDLDGLLNVEEFIAGTNPDDPDDQFQVDVRFSGGNVIVALDGLEATGADYQLLNRFYAIEQRPVLDASPGGWIPATGYEAVEVTGQETIAYTNSAADPMTLYRGRVWLETE